MLQSRIISEIAQSCYLRHTKLSANQVRPSPEYFLLTLSRYQESENSTLGTRLAAAYCSLPYQIWYGEMGDSAGGNFSEMQVFIVRFSSLLA